MKTIKDEEARNLLSTATPVPPLVVVGVTMSVAIVCGCVIDWEQAMQASAPNLEGMLVMG